MREALETGSELRESTLQQFVMERLGREGFVADHDALSTEVNNDLKSVQFTITDIGSDWVSTDVEHEITHKGKKEKIKSKVGVKLSKKLAKAKGMGRFGGKEKHR